MKKLFGCIAVAVLALSPPLAAAEQVPAGKETLTLDSMSKARQAAGKKVLKGPVPFAHQAHVAAGTACTDCHHKEQPGDTPNPCSSCHKDTKGDAPKINDAFHGGEGSLPSLFSCIGCHARKVATTKVTEAPVSREPCTACHSLLKK